MTFFKKKEFLFSCKYFTASKHKDSERLGLSKFLIIISGKVTNAVGRNKIRRWMKNLILQSDLLLNKSELTLSFIFKPNAKDLFINENGFNELKLALQKIISKV